MPQPESPGISNDWSCCLVLSSVSIPEPTTMARAWDALIGPGLG